MVRLNHDDDNDDNDDDDDNADDDVESPENGKTYLFFFSIFFPFRLSKN